MQCQTDNQFRKEMESLGVTPLGQSPKAAPEKERPIPNNKNSVEADRQVLVESISTNPALSKHAAESGEELKKSGLATRDFTRLKQGNIYRENELYLRGYTVENAVKKLKLFLHESTRSGHRCVKIIHGKGHELAGWYFSHQNRMPTPLGIKQICIGILSSTTQRRRYRCEICAIEEVEILGFRD